MQPLAFSAYQRLLRALLSGIRVCNKCEQGELQPLSRGKKCNGRDLLL